MPIALLTRLILLSEYACQILFTPLIFNVLANDFDLIFFHNLHKITTLETVLKKTLDASIFQYLMEFTDRIKRDGDTLLQKHDLTTQQWTILLHLAKDPNLPFFAKRSPQKPIMASELAHHFNVTRANITNLINSLTEKQLIIQEADNADRRRKILKLTEQGEALVSDIEQLREAANQRLFANFSENEKVMLLDLASRCIASVEQGSQ